jgi:hypothetical protein
MISLVGIMTVLLIYGGVLAVPILSGSESRLYLRSSRENLDSSTSSENLETPGTGRVVSVDLAGQLGNQLFELAAGYAYALDINATLVVPDLQTDKYGIPHNYEHLFKYVDAIHADKITTSIRKWAQPSFHYSQIPLYDESVELSGYFQSEKFFAHHENEIRAAFAAPEHIRKTLLATFPILGDPDVLTVGVQVRDYYKEQPHGRYHPTMNESYYFEAMSKFPEDAIFFVSTNNGEHARHATRAFAERCVYMDSVEGIDYISEFFALTLCKGFVISNSSFGWWAAWLSVFVNKVVYAPWPWFAMPYQQSMAKDIYPPSWQRIDVVITVMGDHGGGTTYLPEPFPN